MHEGKFKCKSLHEKKAIWILKSAFSRWNFLQELPKSEKCIVFFIIEYTYIYHIWDGELGCTNKKDNNIFCEWKHSNNNHMIKERGYKNILNCSVLRFSISPVYCWRMCNPCKLCVNCSQGLYPHCVVFHLIHPFEKVGYFIHPLTGWPYYSPIWIEWPYYSLILTNWQYYRTTSISTYAHY